MFFFKKKDHFLLGMLLGTLAGGAVGAAVGLMTEKKNRDAVKKTASGVIKKVTCFVDGMIP